MNKDRQKLKIYDDWFEYFKDSISDDHLGYNVIFVSDCDGILTDGRSYFNENKTHKSYGSYDKEAIRFIVDYMGDSIQFVSDDSKGYIITNSRINHLNLSTKSREIFCSNKGPKARYELLKNIHEQQQMAFDEKYILVFLGDSLSDIPALSVADIAMTTNNAPDEVKKYCNYVSPLNGGMGGFADCIFHFYENLKDVKSILNI